MSPLRSSRDCPLVVCVNALKALFDSIHKCTQKTLFDQPKDDKKVCICKLFPQIWTVLKDIIVTAVVFPRIDPVSLTSSLVQNVQAGVHWWNRKPPLQPITNNSIGIIITTFVKKKHGKLAADSIVVSFKSVNQTQQLL